MPNLEEQIRDKISKIGAEKCPCCARTEYAVHRALGWLPQPTTLLNPDTINTVILVCASCGHARHHQWTILKSVSS